jgi:hypothetical protein
LSSTIYILDFPMGYGMITITSDDVDS